MQSFKEVQDEIIFSFVTYFIPTETKLSILVKQRNFDRLEQLVKKSLIYFFSSKLKDEYKLEVYDIIFDTQVNYYNILIKKWKEYNNPNNQKLLKEIENKFNLLNNYDGIGINKIKNMKKLTDTLDCTKSNIIKNINADEDVDIKVNKIIENIKEKNIEIEKVFDEYAKAYGKYCDFIEKSHKFNTNKFLHSSHTFINEFIQFFTHYTYSYLAFKEEQCLDKNKYLTYILKNQKRGINHLERAILDIYKILAILLDNHNKFTFKDYIEILGIRQNEIDNISNSIYDKITRYKNFLEKPLNNFLFN